MSARWAAALVLGFALALAMPATALAAEGDKAASADDGAAAPKESVELVCKTTLAGVRGWQSTDGGKLAGRKSGSAAVTALRIAYKGMVDGSIKYQTYQATGGWSDYAAANKTSGTKRAANPIQALRVKLTGELSKRYNVYYRANLVGYGWTGWGKNGQAVGARKLASVRGYQVKLVKKGKKAPGSAKNRYFSKGAASAEAFYAQGGKTRTQLTRALNKAKGANSGLKAFGGTYNFNSKAGKKLKAAIKNLGRYKLSFTMIDLKTGRGISYNPTKVLYIASSIKGPYVAAINKYRAGSVGAGTRATMSSTIKVSSNEGYSSLRRRFGHGIMKKMMNYCGISEKEMTSTRNYPYMSSRTLAKLWVGTYWSYYRETNTRSAWARGQYGKLANLVRAIDGVHADMVK